MNKDQAAAMKDAHTRCAQLPNYSGSIVVVFQKDFSEVQLGHTVNPQLVVDVLEGLLKAIKPPPPIILPASHPRGRGNGSG